MTFLCSDLRADIKIILHMSALVPVIHPELASSFHVHCGIGLVIHIIFEFLNANFIHF